MQTRTNSSISLDVFFIDIHTIIDMSTVNTHICVKYFEWICGKLEYRFSMISQVNFKWCTQSGGEWHKRFYQMYTIFLLLSSLLMFIFFSLLRCLFQICFEKKDFEQNEIKFDTSVFRYGGISQPEMINCNRKKRKPTKRKIKYKYTLQRGWGWERDAMSCVWYVLVNRLMSMFSIIMWHLRYERNSKKKSSTNKRKRLSLIRVPSTNACTQIIRIVYSQYTCTHNISLGLCLFYTEKI